MLPGVRRDDSTAIHHYTNHRGGATLAGVANDPPEVQLMEVSATVGVGPSMTLSDRPMHKCRDTTGPRRLEPTDTRISTQSTVSTHDVTHRARNNGGVAAIVDEQLISARNDREGVGPPTVRL